MESAPIQTLYDTQSIYLLIQEHILGIIRTYYTNMFKGMTGSEKWTTFNISL
jgi:hypothetical protein